VSLQGILFKGLFLKVLKKISQDPQTRILKLVFLILVSLVSYPFLGLDFLHLVLMASSSSKRKAPVVKRPRTTLNPSTMHLQYLLSPQLAPNFEPFSSYEILQERFIKFKDFPNYEIDSF